MHILESLPIMYLAGVLSILGKYWEEGQDGPLLLILVSDASLEYYNFT